MRIGIDLGHGGSDKGAVKYSVEKERNNEFGSFLFNAFKNLGHKEVFIVPDGANANDDLAVAVNWINSNKMDLVISIHANAGGGTGSETWVQKGYNTGTTGKLAKAVNDGYINGIRLTYPDYVDRGIKQGDLYVLRNTNCPAVLLETGFVDNLNDSQKLENDNAMNLTAFTLAKKVLLDFGLLVDVPITPAEVFDKPDIYMRGHLQDFGWEKDFKISGGLIGTKGESKRLEALDVVLGKPLRGKGSLRIILHIQNEGDKIYIIKDRATIGTVGKSLRIEGISLEFIDGLENIYGLVYQGHIQDIGDTGYVKETIFVGARGKSKRLEALQYAVFEK